MWINQKKVERKVGIAALLNQFTDYVIEPKTKVFNINIFISLATQHL